MAHSFLATSLKPTAVNRCVVGSFTEPDVINLILAKSTTLQIYLFFDERLKLLKEINVSGKVEQMILFSRTDNAKSSKQNLFILTHKYHMCVLECEKDDYTDSYNIITKAYGSAAEKIGIRSETGIITCIDPCASMIGARFYDGIFKVIELDIKSSENSIRELKTYNINMDESRVTDMQFLHGFKTPVVALIYQANDIRYFKTYVIEQMDFSPGPWLENRLESESSFMISICEPFGGVLVIGQESILYIKDKQTFAVRPPIIKSNAISCYAKIDDNGLRYLLGDIAGRLFILIIECSENIETVKDIKLEFLGDISIAEDLVYLDAGFVFIASQLGDSQLIHLHSRPKENGVFFDVVETFTNIGPIVDMILLDTKKCGQEELVTCSGAFKEGSLRFIRNGIGVSENGVINLEGVYSVWAFPVDDEEMLLILSFLSHTKVISFKQEVVEEMSLEGVDLDEKTYSCSNFVLDDSSFLIQITPVSVNLLLLNNNGGDKFSLINKWSSDNEKKVTVACAYQNKCLCANDKELHFIEVDTTKKFKVQSVTMTNEISCLNMNPLSSQSLHSFCVVGLWIEMSVHVLSLPSLSPCHIQALTVEFIPRSLFLCSFESLNFLFCGMGDGSLLYYEINAKSGTLTNEKKVTLGTQPLTLLPFTSNSDDTNIFCCCDRPYVIHFKNRNVYFTSVNLDYVSCITDFNHPPYYPKCLVIACQDSVRMGSINDIQKLHIKTLPLFESPRRIALHKTSQFFCILSVRTDLNNGTSFQPIRESASTKALNQSSNRTVETAEPLESYSNSTDTFIGEEIEMHSLLLIDQNNLDVVWSHTFQINEFATCLVTGSLGNDATDYIVVATAMVIPEETEPNCGKIYVFSHNTNKKLQRITDVEIFGAAYTLLIFKSKLLATINNVVRLYEWNSCTKELSVECSLHTQILSLYAKVYQDLILVGDLMHSITLIRYKPMEGILEETSRDCNPAWTSAVEIIDDNHFLVAENNFNLFICARDMSSSDVDNAGLSSVAHFHHPEFVNVFSKGSLISSTSPCEPSLVSSCILAGTISGSIFSIFQLKPNYYNLLLKVQENMYHEIKMIGKISQKEFRYFWTDHKTEVSVGFIDGDFVELFNDVGVCSEEMKEKIVEGIKWTDDEGSEVFSDVKNISKIIEDISRYH